MAGTFIQDKLIHYEILGRGQPVIFIHGWLGSWRYWVPVMEVLSSEYRTYALDLWGFGDSEKDHNHYNVDSYVHMVSAFMDELGIARAPVIGHTLGAAIATQLAASQPARVSKVLAVGLPLSADSINRRLLSASSNDLMARLFWQRQRPYKEVEMGVSQTAANLIALSIQTVARLDTREILHEIDAPLLSIYGEKDPVIDPAQAEEFGETYYAARTIVFSGARHFPMLDHTAKFSRLVLDFMDVETANDLQALAIKKEWRRRTR
jgi:pimeloyl-ACP methyl ester carboxylesterase